MRVWQEIELHVNEFGEQDYEYVMSHFSDFNGQHFFNFLEQEYNFTHIMAHSTLLKTAPLTKRLMHSLEVEQREFEAALCSVTNYLLHTWGLKIYDRLGNDSCYSTFAN